MRMFRRSTTTSLLLLTLLAAASSSLASVHAEQNDKQIFHNQLIEQTRQLIQTVNEATASSPERSLLTIRGLQTQDEADYTTVLDDGTTVVSIQPICRALEQNFVHNVTCTCTGSSLSFFSITCRYDESVCSLTGTSCGSPVLALSMVNFAAFSATSCVYNYTRNNVELPDVCISLQTCPYATTSDAGIQQQSFCGCMAQVNGKSCSECSLCRADESGLVMDNSPGSAATTGVFLNCSNQNAEFITESCSALDLDLDVSGLSSAMSGFLPNFNGLCSQLESGLDNKIACDCSDSGGGNFNVTCKTTDEQCYKDKNETVCGQVQSLVLVEEGIVANVTACSDYSKPHNLEPMCVSFALEKGSDQENRIVNCDASYDGQPCSCSLCDNNQGVNLDCTKAAPWAKIDSCQPINSVYEFLPAFPDAPKSSAKTLTIGGISVMLLLFGFVC
ncbi:hypothetical protein MPSEU_000609700 [Mayamaea pseudoterrestris]|nr:hypothetical protein MPSEU_000609700 [Mayamaea pseudoterrestris]